MCDESKKSIWYRGCKGDRLQCPLCSQIVCHYHGAANNGGLKGGHSGCKGSCSTSVIFSHMCAGHMQRCDTCGNMYCKYHSGPVPHVGKVKGGHVCSGATVGGKAVNSLHNTIVGPPSVGSPSATSATQSRQLGPAGSSTDVNTKPQSPSRASPVAAPIATMYPETAVAPPPYSPDPPESATPTKSSPEKSGGPTAINEPGRWDFFLSHTQRSGQATTLASELFSALTAEGYSCWFDVRMRDKSMLAMYEGILNSTVVVAIITGPTVNPDSPDDDPVTNAYFSRDCCLRELQWACESNVQIQPAVRSEDKKKIGELMDGAPANLKHLLDIDFIDFDRSKAQRFKVDVDSLIEVLVRVQQQRRST